MKKRQQWQPSRTSSWEANYHRERVQHESLIFNLYMHGDNSRFTTTMNTFISIRKLILSLQIHLVYNFKITY